MADLEHAVYRRRVAGERHNLDRWLEVVSAQLSEYRATTDQPASINRARALVTASLEVLATTAQLAALEAAAPWVERTPLPVLLPRLQERHRPCAAHANPTERDAL